MDPVPEIAKVPRPEEPQVSGGMASRQRQAAIANRKRIGKQKLGQANGPSPAAKGTGPRPG